MLRIRQNILLLVVTSFIVQSTYAEIDADLFAGLKARSIGPATDSGRAPWISNYHPRIRLQC